MQIAPDSTIFLASSVDATPIRPLTRDRAAAPAAREQVWIAPSAVGRGRLIDLLV